VGRRALLVIVVAGCGRVGFDAATSSSGSNMTGDPDAGPDAMCGMVELQDLACASPLTGTYTEQRTFDCSMGAGAWTPWTQVAYNCICTTSSQPRQYSCAGGIIMQQRDVLCPQGTWSAWMNTTETCPGLVWQPFSDSTGPFATALSATVGATCAPSGAMMACSTQAGGGMYNHFASCTCQ